MKQGSKISVRIFFNNIAILLMTCFVLTILPFGYARDNSNTFAFNGLNGINNKSDSMFYNDNAVGNRRAPVPFIAAIGHKLSDGVEVTATGSQYAVKLIPITLSQGTGTRTGNRITYVVAPGVEIIYTFKSNGVKEDIVFDHPCNDLLDLTFKLELDPMLEARLDKKGNILIYGPNALLSNYIQTGDEKSAELILKARQHAVKDNLLYIIPSPVIIDGAGVKHNNMAYYAMEQSIFTLHLKGLAHLHTPVSIDPSIVVTTTTDFMTGNNEGMISFDVDAISRAAPSGGSIGNWTATTSLPTARFSHTSVAYNGYLYVLGGWNGSACLSDVLYAPINANGTVGAWTATTNFTTARWSHTSVAYNGYLYVIGGYNDLLGCINDVQFAPINSDGTLGTWATTSSFITARELHTSVAYNGYLYVIGGNSCGTALNDVQFAPIHANGTVGAWTATTSLSTARESSTSVAYNGYLYVLGGWSGSANLNSVQYAPLNADGTIGAWTTAASFHTARSGHSSVVSNGYLYVLGGYDGSTYIDDVQFAPINSNGTVGAWTAAIGFSTPHCFHASAAYDRYLYLIGGSDGGLLSDVQFAQINPNGAVGTWTATTPFSTPRYAHRSVVYNGYLYVLGGWADAAPGFNDVQFAPINADGTLGAWTATTSFTTARYAHSSVVYNGYLYVIGGYGGGYLSDVQFAPINANGTIGAWTATTNFPTAREGHSSVVSNGYLYVIGGYNGTYLNDVRFAPINANGTIGAWTATTSFPTARGGHSSVVSNGYLYVLGGRSGTSTYLNDVQFAPLNANGTIGSWTATTSLPTARSYHTSVLYNGYLYVLGGRSSSSTYLNDVQLAPLNANGTIGSWTAAASFPTARFYHASVISDGYLYVIGGSAGLNSYFNDVQFALINANGTVGTWTYTTSFTTPRYSHTSVAYNGYLYVIGGWSGSVALNDVQFAPINTDGTVGTWTATTSFTTPRYSHTSVVYNGYLYVIGGWSGSAALNDVQFAPINTNGTVGTWTATTSFATARFGHTSVAYSGYLYVICGGPGTGYLNDVQYAPLNPNGTVGMWIATTSLAIARLGHTSVVYNGYLYVIGGGGSAGILNDVQFAYINANGTIGVWNATASLNKACIYHSAAAYNGYLYVLGGTNGTTPYFNDVYFAPVNSNGTIEGWIPASSFVSGRFRQKSVVYNGYLYVIGGENSSGTLLNDVQFATLNGPAARAHYSKLLDIGSDQIVESIQFSNGGAKGITNLIYTVAPSSTAIFSSRTMISDAMPSMLYTTGLNTCGRYMWVNFDMDDTISATIDNGGLNGRGNILDFTITYDALAGVGTSILASKSSINVHLLWSISPLANSYNVLRCNATTIPCTPVTIASPIAASYDDPVLADSNNYWYSIQAVNGTCVSP